MNKHTYTHEGTKYTRISKANARKRYNSDEIITIAPCNMVPVSAWGATGYSTSRKQTECTDFNTLVVHFEHYSCTNETGRYASFWTKEEVQ